MFILFVPVGELCLLELLMTKERREGYRLAKERA
jgi:hypothetical protein